MAEVAAERAGRDAVRQAGKFLVLTFAVTWGLWKIVLQVVGDSPDPSRTPWLLALGGPVFLIGVFAPGLVAVGLTYLDEGPRAVGTLLGRIGRWNVGIRYYAFALLLIPVVKLSVAVLHRALEGAWPRFGDTNPFVLLAATLFSTLWQAGEEVGWRGYLLPRLTERMGLALASLVVGAIWAVWHLQLFYAPGADTNGQSFPLFALQVTAYSVVLAWIYWRTGGSLLLTMLAHAAFNNLKDIVPSAMAPGSSPFTFDSTQVFRLSVLLLWLVAALLLLRMKGVRRAEGEGPAPA